MATSTTTTQSKAASVAAAVNPVPAWLIDPAKAAAKVITSACSSTVKVAVNIEGMIPLSKDTVRKVVEGRKVIDLL